MRVVRENIVRWVDRRKSSGKSGISGFSDILPRLCRAAAIARGLDGRPAGSHEGNAALICKSVHSYIKIFICRERKNEDYSV